MYRETLIKQVRESSVAGADILRVLDRGVSRLDEFTRIVSPLQEAIIKFEEASSSIDKQLSQVKDMAQLSKEANGLVQMLGNPDNLRNHLKNIGRAQQIRTIYQKNQQYPDSATHLEELTQALSIGYTKCADFLQDQLIKYCEIYALNSIAEDQAQLEMISSIQQLIEVCKKTAPQYWKIYSDIRSALLLRHVKVPQNISKPYVIGSHYIIIMLGSFIESLAIESQLLQMIFQVENVTEWLIDVSEAAYQHFYEALQSHFNSQSNIYQTLDILTAFGQSLPALEQLLGKTVNYYNLSKCFTNLLHKSQSWYRDYSQEIQSAKIDIGEFVHDLAFKLAEEIKKVHLFHAGLNIAKLEQAPSTLIAALLDTFRIKTRAQASKQPALCHIFMINNLSFWIRALQDVEIAGKTELLNKIEKELFSEIEDYARTTWAKLLTILSDNPTIIEFKKQGVLTRTSRDAVKNKFKQFNAEYSEVFNFHKNFTLYSPDVLDTLRKKNHSLIVPAYREFFRKFTSVDFTTRREKYLLYSIERVDSGISSMYILKNR
ncbi:unnamed protein product [Blepharisma stoltei]|uniref:Exocyst subunit Exo70 family protein n=1 Tax=Blepharisma stoltei TaxID=1481888 RepID=A0AAU9JQM2_9CILI|nr:unnamed protein product [Blepharisma stoltei]